MTESKQIVDLEIREKKEVGRGVYLLRVCPPSGRSLPRLMAGQFVQVEVPGGLTLLRRPISVCRYREAEQELWLLIAAVGRGTRAIVELDEGDTLNLILPLGNSFDTSKVKRPLLVGGGVGIAPMLCLAEQLTRAGVQPTVLLGGRTSELVVLREHFEPLATLYITTDDGSLGHRGRVTDHPIIREGDFDAIYCCGPHPMMHAVAQLAQERGIECQVSLENTMACGIGACLCCVQDTHEEGHVCVCTDGPVFSSKSIKW